MSEWYLSFAYVEDRDMLYEICGYVTKGVLDLDGYVVEVVFNLGVSGIPLA